MRFDIQDIQSGRWIFLHGLAAAVLISTGTLPDKSLFQHSGR
jgi:hypothetical protein